MTSKQRAYLRGLANSLDPIVHVGKGGVSDAMKKQADDALTARELIKGRVLETAPQTVKDVAAEIASRVEALVIFTGPGTGPCDFIFTEDVESVTISALK